MAMIRTNGVGIEFYDRVMDRMAERARRPHGVAVHFAGLCEGEINVVTIYRDATARTDVFADFSGPEIANAQLVGPERTDISREEFEVDHLYLDDELKRTVERPVEQPMYAFVHMGDGASKSEYEEAARRSRFPEEWPRGMLLHVACRHGGEQVVVDLWKSLGDAAEFYAKTIQPIAESVMDREAPDLLSSDRAIELHALTVTLDSADPLRSYSRPATSEAR